MKIRNNGNRVRGCWSLERLIRVRAPSIDDRIPVLGLTLDKQKEDLPSMGWWLLAYGLGRATLCRQFLEGVRLITNHWVTCHKGQPLWIIHLCTITHTVHSAKIFSRINCHIAHHNHLYNQFKGLGGFQPILYILVKRFCTQSGCIGVEKRVALRETRVKTNSSTL